MFGKTERKLSVITLGGMRWEGFPLPAMARRRQLGHRADALLCEAASPLTAWGSRCAGAVTSITSNPHVATTRTDSAMPPWKAFMNTRRAIVPLATALLLSACQRPEAPAYEEVRPVRTLVAGRSGGTVDANYSGELVARYESQLGFRVPGKVAARLIEVGSVVKRGQALLRLSPEQEALNLVAATAEAEGGNGGGRVVAAATPEDVVCAGTHTGIALSAVLAR